MGVSQRGQSERGSSKLKRRGASGGSSSASRASARQPSISITGKRTITTLRKLPRQRPSTATGSQKAAVGRSSKRVPYWLVSNSFQDVDHRGAQYRWLAYLPSPLRIALGKRA